MLAELKKEVYEANMLLPRHGLVLFIWGNVSARDAKSGYAVIKPSGVSYELLTAEDMVVVDMDGNVVEGRYRPSSDTLTHIELYKSYPEIGGIVHTHSTWATSWAQAGLAIPCYGTTHADYFYGEIPCTRGLLEEEMKEYEKSTGLVILETLQNREIMSMPGVICKNHGVFSWGKDAFEAVHNAVVLEEVARMAALTKLINPQAAPAPQLIQDKHYFRKHGDNAYYGQK